MTTTISSLYEALGAEGGIRGAVDDFYDRVVADPMLADYFTGVDMKTLRRHQTDSSRSIAASSSAEPWTFGPLNQCRAETSQ